MTVENGRIENLGTITSSGAITMTAGTGSAISNGGTITSSGAITMTAAGGTNGGIFNGGTITSSDAITMTAGTNGVISNGGTITSNGGPILLTAGSGGGITNDAGTIASNGGAVTLVAEGTGSAIINTGTVSSTGGAITLMASTFDNGGFIDSTSASPAAAGNIVILADSMMLQGFQFPASPAAISALASQSGSVPGAIIVPPGSPINAGTSGTVVLGPVTLSNPIVLGTASSPPAGLNLQQSDLDSITAGQLQIGYRNVDGTPSLTGNIDIVSPLIINTSQVPSLLLVTGGGSSVTQNGAITKLVPTSPPSTPPPLSLGVIAGGPVRLVETNQVDTLAGYVDGGTNNFLFRNDSAALTIGTLPKSTLGVTFDAATGNLSAAVMTGPAPNPLAGVTTQGGTINLATTSSGNLVLNQPVNAASGSVELFSASSLIQTGSMITANTLDVSDAAGSVSLPGTNAVATLTGFIGGTFLYRNDSQDLTVGCLSGSCGVSTLGSNIILETTTSGNLILDQTVNANNLPPPEIGVSTILGSAPGMIALSSAGTITQDPTNGLIVGSGLEIQSVGAVSLGATNRLGANDVPQSATGVAATPGVLSGDVITAGQSFLFRDDRAGLTIGTVDVVDSFGARQLNPLTASALPPGGISGVTTNSGNVILETTTAGNLLLSQTVNAGAGLVGLASAGTTTQAPPVIASSLAILSADRVSLGAFSGPNDPNQVGTLAAHVLNAGESFVFRNDSTNLTIGTVDVVDSFGARLLNPVSGAPLTGALSGVVTNNANIGLRVTASGNLNLMANVDAGSAGVGLESAGQIQQTAGTVSGSTLEVSAVGRVSLPDMNAVPVLAGQATGAGNSFLYRNDGLGLTVGTVPTLLESGTGKPPPNNQMLSVAGLSGVTTAGGDIFLETTTSGNLALSQAVNADAGSVGLASAGTIMQSAPITAQNLVARTQLDAGGAITLTNADNAVPGNVTLSTLNTAGTAPAPGAINFFDSTGFMVAAQPGNGLNGLETGVNTTAGITLEGGDTIRIT